MIVLKYPPFRPLGFLTNGHSQTVGAFFFGARFQRKTIKRVVQLSDGDRIVIHDDQPKSWITGDRICVLVHGLGGSHRSPYMQRIAEKLFRSGVRTIRVDMRGFGDSTLLSRGQYSATLSRDIDDIVKTLGVMSPLSKITLIGFSLGAGIILKALGEWSHEHPRSVDSAIAVSPPIDLTYCVANLNKFGNRFYDRFFASRLRRKLNYRRRHVKGLVDNGLNPIPRRLVHYDDRFTAPVSGFKNAREYYRVASPAPLLNEVSVPTLIVAAKDDPLVPVEMFDKWAMSPEIEFVITKHGGHLGFLGRQRVDPDRHWLEWRVSQWVASIDD